MIKIIRKDREITDRNKINEIILSCYCCRLGLNDNGKIYIVPLNFGYSEKSSKRILYFHSAKQGRKIDLIAKNQYAGFELDTNYKLIKGKTACDCSAQFQSIIGEGVLTFINEPQEKQQALQIIMKHNTGKDNWDFADKMLELVCVFKLEINEMSCKEHL